MKEITPQALKARMDAGDDFQLIDVREPHELEICTLNGQHIPMAEIMLNLDAISRSKDVVIHCRSGKRSAAIVAALERQGFHNIFNLKGGILAWAEEVDPEMAKY